MHKEAVIKRNNKNNQMCSITGKGQEGSKVQTLCWMLRLPSETSDEATRTVHAAAPPPQRTSIPEHARTHAALSDISWWRVMEKCTTSVFDGATGKM